MTYEELVVVAHQRNRWRRPYIEHKMWRAKLLQFALTATDEQVAKLGVHLCVDSAVEITLEETHQLKTLYELTLHHR
jgi:hypothetical protein